jgi:hypothetical protein
MKIILKKFDKSIRICIMEIKFDKIMISVYGKIEVETILTQQYTVYYAAYITKIN